jgi:hypothetical protein
LTSDVTALQQSVEKSEVELSSLPADNLTHMLDALLVSDVFRAWLKSIETELLPHGRSVTTMNVF